MSDVDNKWEAFAKRDAEFYILTEKGVDYSSQDGQDFFFSSGETVARESLERALPYLPAKRRALEIGSGIGRLTFPHAKYFDDVCAVDVSPTMLQKLQKGAAQRGLSNIKTFLPEEKWDTLNSFDYAYSFIVFQHISEFRIISSYIKRCANSLVVGGIAQFQFDTRPESFLYRIRNYVPDLLLPKTQRSGIRRVRRVTSELESVFELSGLTVLDQVDRNSEVHVYLLRKGEPGQLGWV